MGSGGRAGRYSPAVGGRGMQPGREVQSVGTRRSYNHIPGRATPPWGTVPRRALPWCRARTQPWLAQRRRPPPGRRPQLAWRPPARVKRWRAGSRGRARPGRAGQAGRRAGGPGWGGARQELAAGGSLTVITSGARRPREPEARARGLGYQPRPPQSPQPPGPHTRP